MVQFDDEEWKMGGVQFDLIDINRSKQTVDLEFYNYQLDKIVILKDIPYNSFAILSKDINQNIKFEDFEFEKNKRYKFDSFTNDLNIDDIIYRVAIEIVAYGAIYNKENYSAINSTLKNGGQIFITSSLIASLNYIQYIVFKNDSRSFDTVLEVLNSNIEEIKTHLL